jgi:hypothetical protein
VRRIGELDVIVPEIVEQFCRLGATLGEQVGGFVILPVLWVWVSTNEWRAR